MQFPPSTCPLVVGGESRVEGLEPDEGGRRKASKQRGDCKLVICHWGLGAGGWGLDDGLALRPWLSAMPD